MLPGGDRARLRGKGEQVPPLSAAAEFAPVTAQVPALATHPQAGSTGEHPRGAGPKTALKVALRRGAGVSTGGRNRGWGRGKRHLGRGQGQCRGRGNGQEQDRAGAGMGQGSGQVHGQGQWKERTGMGSGQVQGRGGDRDRDQAGTVQWQARC